MGLIANFAAYSYCKAHAASYGEIAYQCAYLKALYPAEFFAAVLSNRGGFYSPPVYLEEAKRCGIEIRPPNIDRSEDAYCAEGDALRIGLIKIGQLSQQSIDRILTVRHEAPFEDLADFLRRTALPYTEAELLFRAGVFSGVDWKHTLPRPRQFWQLRQFYQTPRRRGESIYKQSLLGGDSAPLFPDYSARKCAELEWETLGLMSQHHPRHYHLPELQGQQFVASIGLPHYASHTVTVLGWLMAERVWRSKTVAV